MKLQTLIAHIVKKCSSQEPWLCHSYFLTNCHYFVSRNPLILFTLMAFHMWSVSLFELLHPCLEEEVYCFNSVHPSVSSFICKQYFQSHFSQQPCITATSNLVFCFGYGSHMSLTEFRSASYLLSVSRLCSILDSASWDGGVYSVNKNSQISCIFRN